MATAQEKDDAQAAYERLERQAREAKTPEQKTAVIDAILDQGNHLKGLN